MNRNASPPPGFTLVEVLLTAAAIVVLAALSFPVVNRTVEKGRETACIGNLRQIGHLLSLYLNDHQMRLPPAYEYTYLPNGSRLTTAWYQQIWGYIGTGNYIEDYPFMHCPKGELYCYAFERAVSGQRITDIQQNLVNGNPIIPTRWLVMDGNWYFLEKAHGVTGTAGTARTAALRHLERANFLFPDFSVRPLNKEQINSQLYIFTDAPIP